MYSTFVTYTGINFTGASMNPARTLGPAVFSGFESYSWIYYVGPALGSSFAAGLYRLLKAMYVHFLLPLLHLKAWFHNRISLTFSLAGLIGPPTQIKTRTA